MTSSPRILLIDENRGRTETLCLALEESDYHIVTILNGGERIDLEVERRQPDLLIIDLGSPSDEILEQVRSVQRSQPIPVLIFAEDEDRNAIHRAVEAGVSAYVVDDLQDKKLKPIVEAAVARFRELQSLRNELHQVKSSLEERKIIDRAKGIVMQHKGCSEEEAYQSLRQSAMNQNLRIVDIGKNLIASFELLG